MTVLGYVRRYSTPPSSNQALDLRERVSVLLGMAVLVAQPGGAPRRLGRAIAEHRVERDPAKAGQRARSPSAGACGMRAYAL